MVGCIRVLSFDVGSAMAAAIPATCSSPSSSAFASFPNSRDWSADDMGGASLALWLLVALLGVAVTTGASKRSLGPTAVVTACTQAAPRSLLHDEQERLCRFAGQTSTSPSTCAAAVLRATNAFPAASTKSQRTDMVIALCSHASGVGPAVCWLAIPNQVRQQRDLIPTLLDVCQNAPDTVPAECFLQWRKLAASSSRASVQAATADAATLCNAFHGDLRALSSCTLQAPQSLSPGLRFRMCQYATSSDKILAVVACARQLAPVYGASAEMVSRVCALADEGTHPQECVIASVRQLRWMDEYSKAHLCEHASSAEPVMCAVELRRVSRASVAAASSGDQREREPVDAAQLCRRTRNASLTVSCVTKIEARAFTLPQLIRLCTGNANHQQDHVNEPVHASRCVENAKRLLGYFASSDISSDAADLIFQLCDGATSTAPTDCMHSLQYDQALSTAQRVRLCSRAQSPSAQDCYSKLRHLIHAKKLTVDGALALCAQGGMVTPALCVTELARVASTSFMELHAVALCERASSLAPVACYRHAPSSFSDHAKVALCRFADSDAPANCARVSTTRISDSMQKAELCHRATSTYPAVCAMAAPFGMQSTLIVALCRSASSDQPAKCARSIPVSSQITWATIAELCVDAASTTPANCLVQRIRQQRGIVTHALVHECRTAVPAPASLEIEHVSYRCRQLVPKCHISIQLRVHDQFEAEMPSWTGGYLHLSAVPTGDTVLETVSLPGTMDRVLHGPTYAPIANGSAVFADVYFAEAGEFVVTFGASPASPRFPIAEKIARIRIHEDAQERLRSGRCRVLFTRLECSMVGEQQHATRPSDAATDQLHLLELPIRFYLDALGCQSFWSEHAGGLRLLVATPTRLIFGIHRAAYRFLTDASVPSAAMSSWACLGLEEGANRSQIRRAYHRKSLEWHPDKWSSADTRALQSRAAQVYARVALAYGELLRSTS